MNKKKVNFHHFKIVIKGECAYGVGVGRFQQQYLKYFFFF